MRLATLLGSVALAAAWVAAPGFGTSAALAEPADIAAEAEAILAAAYAPDQPGAAAIVMRGGQVIWSGARGLADIEAGRPITPETVFRTGSITKQIVAATVLTLVAEGKVSLDDPLSRFFPDWPQPGGASTVRQLLNHSSAVFDYTKIPGYMLSPPTMRPNSTADLLAVIRSRPSPAGPGERWEYNNSGYVLLGAIIEQVTGQPWHEAVAERIARPLGLSTLGYAVDADGKPGTAHFYSVVNGQMGDDLGVHMSVAHGAGGLVASVGDLAKWAQALHHGRVIAPTLYTEMTSPARLTDGSTRPYGFGLRLLDARGRPALIHGGAGRGVDTASTYVPSEDLFVAVFSNSDELPVHANTVVERLVALALGEPYPVLRLAEVPLAEIEPLLGLYRADEGPDFRFFARGERLFLARGNDEVPLVPAGGDRFFMSPDEVRWVSFERGAYGAHAIAVHRPDGSIARGTRTGPVPPPFAVAAEVLQDYVGTYATEDPVLAVALDADGALTLGPAGQPGIPLRAITETEFRADSAGFRVLFHPENGRTDRITVQRGARELHGTRISQ